MFLCKGKRLTQKNISTFKKILSLYKNSQQRNSLYRDNTHKTRKPRTDPKIAPTPIMRPLEEGIGLMIGTAVSVNETFSGLTVGCDTRLDDNLAVGLAEGMIANFGDGLYECFDDGLELG